MLIAGEAQQALPERAHTPQRITVDGRDALRYGPTRTVGDHMTELIAIPLERDVLVVSCDGPNATDTLRATCAKAAAGAVPLDEHVRPLAPTHTVATFLREAARDLGEDHERARAQMAAAATQEQLRAATQRLASAFTSYAHSVESAPTSAYDGSAVRALAEHARRASDAYYSLADATTDAQWRARRARALAREQELLDAEPALTALGYERTTSRR
jgi:molybdopterin-guanine dinucleotide biosynthesis protein A